MLAGIIAGQEDSAHGSGAPAGYVARAVVFNSCALVLSSCTCTDNYFFGFAGWFKSAWTPGGVVSNDVAFVVDPLVGYDSYLAGFGVSPSKPAEFNIQNASGDDLLADFDGVGTTVARWDHIIGAAMTNGTNTTKVVVVYVNDVKRTITYTAGSTPFTITTNGLPVYVGCDSASSLTNKWNGSMADVSIWPGIDLMQGGSDISSIVRRLFIDASGKAVNPTTAIAALGDPPIFLSGDASTFRLNTLGTSGAFTISAGSLSDDTSPPP